MDGLIVDLEVVPAGDEAPARIFKIGALRQGSGETLELDTDGGLDAALRRLDALAEGADCVLGHNILDHDLPLLRAAAPDLRLLRLPVVDTLRLSPLAFPQDPYHQLVKDYKAVAASRNSPLADCRATAALFDAETEALAALGARCPELLDCYQTLLTERVDGGLGAWFAGLTGHAPHAADWLVGALRGLLVDETTAAAVRVCPAALEALLAGLVVDTERRWSLAYALSWLLAGAGEAVLAPWVRHQFPATAELIARLRDTPCGDPACAYCAQVHDPRTQLRRYFGFEDFRREPEGGSLQHDLVLGGMRGESLLAVLPTGGGKSLCYQLPALNRYQRNGALTVIVSPLQSLMKDQVDGLLAHNLHCVATLNGLLTLPERADVLDRIRRGAVGLLLVSPEQFRNRAFRAAIAQREVGAWIFDEAHCLSKWGNDFRPDYLYVARFIRRFGGDDAPVAPVGCFTATAKPDVLEDIRAHFTEVLGIGFRDLIGTPRRANLDYGVLPVGAAEKPVRIHQLLTETFPEPDSPGGAVVFAASRRHAEELADFLSGQDWDCRHFHAGLAPNAKKDIQDAFKRGELRVIVATNAFGMGVDKPDVRLVVHADIPGSLENYLQEAGRAGRDGQAARCVLLYDPQDIETQFGLAARTQLSLRDIQQILRALRKIRGARGDAAELVVSSGEILQHAALDAGFDADADHAEIKVVTAIAWLERAALLERDVNETRIFPARLHEPDRARAAARLDRAGLPRRQRAIFDTVLDCLYAAAADARIDTDTLARATGTSGEEVTGVLRQLEQLGLVDNDTQLTLYLRHGVSGAAKGRLERCLALEQALFALLPELAPDADQGEWQDLNLPRLTARLREETGQDGLSPPRVLRLLRGLAQERDGDSRQPSAFELDAFSRDHLRLRLRGRWGWRQIREFGERRRALAATLLRFLIARIPEGVRRKDVLVSTTFGELLGCIEGDAVLAATLRPEQRRAAIEHVLLFLHQQEVLALNHGMTVMRRAMTIALAPERTGGYQRKDHDRLDAHYRERRFQIHAMREYAERALDSGMDAARTLLADYFSQSRQAFQRRYFAGKAEVLKLATSEASWRAIVEPLNAIQRGIVTAHDDRNRLVLAGPGSGKTRVVVHRIAYLLRVLRVPAASIIALTFNRHAANQIRRRLFDLVGRDAWGLTVLTYHAMAMRLTGTSFERRDSVDEARLDEVLDRAAALLAGTVEVDGEDDLREQLLRGYRYILVDEYQDIDDRQYRLVSALARRRAEGEQDAGLCILAVGDDDQNIYAWRGGNNRHIERYREEYDAEIAYLVENYRSSGAIVAAANRLIATNPDRLKEAHPVRVDAERAQAPSGGRWAGLDPVAAGRVCCLRLPEHDRASGNQQAQAALGELRRLLALEGKGEWQGCAVLARSHRYLRPLQAWCERAGVPYHLAAEQGRALPLTRERGFLRVIDALRALSREQVLDAAAAGTRIAALGLEPRWRRFFAEALVALAGELGDCQLAPATLIDWLYDHAREIRQQPRPGLFLGTVHAAKGLEFRHLVLLDGDWRAAPEAIEEMRRLYYVGMTRARESLTLCAIGAGNPCLDALGEGVFERQVRLAHDPELEVCYQPLGLQEIDLGYPGRQPAAAPIHAAIAAIAPGERLFLDSEGERYLLRRADGQVVGRTARAFRLGLVDPVCEVVAIIRREAEDSEPPFRSKLRCTRWEVVVPRLIGRPQRRVAALSVG
ncbi:RecQ family ATP-dependent DNA helicase [Marichromatium gracile]|uniref:RecQ family ATP-dependent DNA helicase n=1 Tax=Marichromatium gracile TaxID=1048 RepID=UPI001F44664D|nr:RecQ family ATP-dependent DNA helicase [Marichromatium gracile]MCF1183586.1 RecQ family ATP-dependent DNA helicase [Marichromatium gracile]